MSLLSGLFSTQKTPTYSGMTPYSSLMDAAGGKDYYNRILARSQGQGVGYSPDYVNQSTNPVIARMKGDFGSYQIPELKSELTATGRRAGSSGFQQLGQAYRNEGLDEAAAYAPIYQQAQEAARQDTNSGIQDLGSFNTGDYNARNTAAGFEKNTFDTSMSNLQKDRAANNAKGEKIGQAAVGAAAAPFTGGASLAFMGGGGSGGGYDASTMSTPPAGYNFGYGPNGMQNWNPMQKQIMSRSRAGQSGRVV